VYSIVNGCLERLSSDAMKLTQESCTWLTDSQQRSMQPVNIQHHHSPVMDAARKPQRPKRGDYCDFLSYNKNLQQHVMLMLNRVLFIRSFKLHWVDIRVEFRTFEFLNYTQWNCVWRSGWFIRPSMYCWLIYILDIIVIQTLTAKLGNEQLHRVENRNQLCASCTRKLTGWFWSLYLHVYAVILIDAYIVYASLHVL